MPLFLNVYFILKTIYWSITYLEFKYFLSSEYVSFFIYLNKPLQYYNFTFNVFAENKISS